MEITVVVLTEEKNNTKRSEDSLSFKCVVIIKAVDN